MAGDLDPNLSRDKIIAALHNLDLKLRENHTIGEACLFGGTVMVLAFNARLSTRDVDAIFHPATLIRELAAKVAAEEGLSPDWLNDGVKGFQSERPELTQDSIPQFANLRVYRPSAEYLLAMKCLAARAADADTPGDQRDISFLIKHLNLKTVEDVLDLVTRYYSADRLLPKTQFMIHEVMAEIASEK